MAQSWGLAPPPRSAPLFQAVPTDEEAEAQRGPWMLQAQGASWQLLLHLAPGQLLLASGTWVPCSPSLAKASGSFSVGPRDPSGGCSPANHSWR